MEIIAVTSGPDRSVSQAALQGHPLFCFLDLFILSKIHKG